MNLQRLSQRALRYGVVGVVAAAIHYGVLRGLSTAAPEWLANPLAFLVASLAGYLGHALLTFREETGGRRFARRWLLLQYGVNLSVCSLLPLLLPGEPGQPLRNLILIFTPTLLNALIWSRAARFSARQRRQAASKPLIHADDLGLAREVDQAILELAERNRLDGASLLVNGESAETAARAWNQLNPRRPLCLHLCLTEGPSVPGCPDLPAGFGSLLLASLLPGRRRRLQHQLERSIRHQIDRFRELTGQRRIHLDGHQHIQLVPIVLHTLLSLASSQSIVWIRTTREPLPTGLPLACWGNAVISGGVLKWIVLQILTAWARPRLKREGISTNGSFGGVLFTGQMTGARLKAIERELRTAAAREEFTANLLLAHPAAAGASRSLDQTGFSASAVFFSSPGRQEEWQALRTREPHGRSSEGAV